jgi:chloramphenicol-sensitive protein RarD
VASKHEITVGLTYAIAAYAWWGIVPIYWKLLTHISPAELTAHRALWCVPLFGGLLWLRGRVPELREKIRDRKVGRVFVVSSALLALCWLTFVYAVETDRVLHVSLGYFINPIVSVLLGRIVLGERLRRLQWVAVALAAAGVAQLSTEASELPWISLVLAFSFGLYGLARKTAPMDALPGSTLEVLIMLPFAVAYLAWIGIAGDGHFSLADPTTDALLVGTGIITAVPLLWFANGARRLPLSTIGFVQYLAPTGHFLLAVLAFGEPFSALHWRAFACIWAGVAVFSIEAWRRSSRG